MKTFITIAIIFLLAVSNIWAWFHIHALWKNQTTIVQVISDMDEIQELHQRQLESLYVSAKGQHEHMEMVVRILHGLYGYDEPIGEKK